jgi:hypothetical protein
MMMFRNSHPCFLALAAAAFITLAGTVVAVREADSPARRPDKFTCLPKDIRADETVSYGRKASQEITVAQKLREMKASCRNGKLVDAKGREIRFFRPSCWGNPPPDYLEIQERENKELANLKKRYTVVVFSCNPMMQ